MSPIKEQISIADVVVMIITLSVLIFTIFIAVNAEKTVQNCLGMRFVKSILVRTMFTKNGGRSADFCVGDSGIPKYPKTWIEKR